jgi:hypothetical protein
MRRHWAPRELFLAAAVPAFISAVVMYSMRWAMKQPTQPVAAGEALVHQAFSNPEVSLKSKFDSNAG